MRVPEGRNSFEIVRERVTSLTEWAGNVDLQCATMGVADGDVELNVLEETNDIVLAFATVDVKIDLQWTSSTELSAEKNRAPVGRSIVRLLYENVLRLEFLGFDLADALLWYGDPVFRCFSHSSGIQEAKAETAVHLETRNNRVTIDRRSLASLSRFNRTSTVYMDYLSRVGINQSRPGLSFSLLL